MRRLAIIGGLLAGLCIAVLVVAPWVRSSPRVVLLLPARGAQWIRIDQPLDLVAHANTATTTYFQTEYTVSPDNAAASSGAAMRLMALGRAVVLVDNKKAFVGKASESNWKVEKRIAFPSWGLSVGKHSIGVRVIMQNGPALLRMDCPELGIRTGRTWQASADLQSWTPAITAQDIADPPISLKFETTASDLRRLWPGQVALFIAATIAIAQVFRRGNEAALLRYASLARWVLMLAWLALALDTLWKLPVYVGYDAQDHFLYIQYIARNASLPIPNSGWETFQTPVYYVVSAALYRLFASLNMPAEVLASDLRIVPLVCGAVLTQICYACASVVFPRRGDLRLIATLAGGLVPVNVYMAQSLSNEPMAGVMGGLVVLLTLRFLYRSPARPLRSLVVIGLMLAIAVLTKVSAVVWFFPVTLMIAVKLLQSGGNRIRQIWLSSVPAMVAVIACLPYFFSNHLRSGQWIFTNAERSDLQWWQDPGYRVPSNFIEFGHVFSRPAYSGVYSVWDSLYSTFWAGGFLSGIADFEHRPPWNYGLMSCGLWLAMIPILLMILGGLRAVVLFRRSEYVAYAIWFSVIGVLSFILAVVYVYLTLPIFSCAKGSYLIGTLPCVGLLVAGGCELLFRRPLFRAVVMGLLFTWALDSFLTYFVF